MPDFGIMRGFNDKLFGDKLVAGQLPTQLGLIGSLNITSFLLDSYPGAAAAYSVRLLKSTYTGSAIRVRRSSDNTEQDIGFSGTNLDTTSLTSFCGAGNGFVTTWYDQSGNGYNATQSTAANQPQIVSSGIVILENGNPCLDMLYSAGYTTSISISQPFTFYGVVTRSGATNSIIFDGQNGSTRSYVFRATNWLANSGLSITSTNADNTQILINSLHNSTSSKLYINSVLAASGDIGTNSLGSPTIGTNKFQGTYFDGSFQELIFYPSDQSSNRTGIETNINTFYSIY